MKVMERVICGFYFFVWIGLHKFILFVRCGGGDFFSKNMTKYSFCGIINHNALIVFLGRNYE